MEANDKQPILYEQPFAQSIVRMAWRPFGILPSTTKSYNELITLFKNGLNGLAECGFNVIRYEPVDRDIEPNGTEGYKDVCINSYKDLPIFKAMTELGLESKMKVVFAQGRIPVITNGQKIRETFAYKLARFNIGNPFLYAWEIADEPGLSNFTTDYVCVYTSPDNTVNKPKINAAYCALRAAEYENSTITGKDEYHMIFNNLAFPSLPKSMFTFYSC